MSQENPNYSYKTASGRGRWPSRDPIGSSGGVQYNAYIQDRTNILSQLHRELRLKVARKITNNNLDLNPFTETQKLVDEFDTNMLKKYSQPSEIQSNTLNSYEAIDNDPINKFDKLGLATLYCNLTGQRCIGTAQYQCAYICKIGLLGKRNMLVTRTSHCPCAKKIKEKLK